MIMNQLELQNLDRLSLPVINASKMPICHDDAAGLKVQTQQGNDNVELHVGSTAGRDPRKDQRVFAKLIISALSVRG